MKNKYKVILMILILIILSGIITLGILGFEKSIRYKAGTRIEVYIPKGYEKQDILNIAKECFTNRKIDFEEVEKFNQIVSIKVEDYTKDELNSYKAKISEKYGIAQENLEIYEVLVPKTRIRTIVMPYVMPVLIVTILSLIYIGIRNIKNEKPYYLVIKKLLILMMILGVYFSLILIFRLPFGAYTMPLALAIYVISLILLTNNINK